MTRWCTLRRSWRGSTGLLLWGLGLLGAGGARPAAADPPASLLLVTLDTTRADHLGAYGASFAVTPALDRLARQGATFLNAYATTPVTLPSHASILTGLYPPRHGVRNNGAFYLEDRVTTLTEVLRHRGFRTAAFVSAAVLDSRYGLDQGFEVYDDDLSAGRPKELRMVAERRAEVTVDAALAWLDRLSASERFFLWLHLFDPHLDYAPPAPYDTRFANRPYDGEIAYMDAQLGRLLAHRRAAARQETVVMVLADHGESLGEHDEASHALLAYDATLRIPWLLRIPSGPGGITVSHPVSQVDVFPTALDLLGLLEPTSPGHTPEGESQAAWVAGGPRGRPPERTLYAETLVPYFAYGWAQLRTVRVEEWKLIDAPTRELYHLKTDPGELDNVFRHHPVRAADLLRRLATLDGDGELRETGRLPGDARAEEQLRSLGYLSSQRSSGGPKLVRLDPKDVMDLHRAMERAQHLLFGRRFEAAVREFRKILHRDRNNLAAIRDLATALGELGRFEDALRALRRALELSPRDPSLHLSLATLEDAAHGPQRALAVVDLALALDPRLLDAGIEKADYLARLGRATEAAALLTRALGENPHHPRLNVRYAELVELPAQELAPAEARLRRAVAREPFLATGWSVLGKVLEKAGRPVEAISAYRQGLVYQPREARLHAQLGLMLSRFEEDPVAGQGPSQGRVDDAEGHLRQALRLLPEPDPELRNVLGDWLMSKGRENEAEAEYRGVLTQPPPAGAAAGYRNERAKALFRLGRLEEAETEWLRLLAEDGDTVTVAQKALAQANLASLAVSRGQWEEARRLAQTAVESDAALASGWNNLAIAHEELGEVEEALGAYRRAVDTDPGYWQARFNLGLLLRKLRRFTAAAEVFQQVLRLRPRHAKSHYELGILFAGPLRQWAKAKQHLRVSLEAEPDHPRTGKVRQLLESLEGTTPP